MSLQLDYRPPEPPEPLGSWFRRRFIHFICTIVGVILVLKILPFVFRYVP